MGQRIRNELIFQSTGGGVAPTPTMRLEIAIRESVTSTLVRTDGDAQGQIYSLEAAFKLVRIADNSVVLTGTSYARAGFERFEFDLLQRACARGCREQSRQHHRRGSEVAAHGLSRRGRLRPPAMAAIKAHQAQAYLSRPDPQHRAVLFFGSDAGLVAERAHALAKAFAARTNPPGEIVRLDDTDLDGDPSRLTVELGTVPMFGGPKIVRAVAGRRVNAAALKPMLEDGSLLDGTLIVEAGNLKPDEALRALFEKSAAAAAIACYADGSQDLEGLIREVLKGAGLGIAAGCPGGAGRPARRR